MEGVDYTWIGTLIVGLAVLTIAVLFNDSLPLSVVYVCMAIGAGLSVFSIFRASESIR